MRKKCRSSTSATTTRYISQPEGYFTRHDPSKAGNELVFVGGVYTTNDHFVSTSTSPGKWRPHGAPNPHAR
jgi:hypothetical protein